MAARNGFQTFVTTQLPPAQAGDFASQNPRAVALTSIGAALGLTPGFRVAASQAVTVGYFAWAAPATGLVYSSEAGAGAGSVIGFVANVLQTIVTAFLGQTRVTIEAGFPVDLFVAGDFWADVAGRPVVAGDPIYAVLGTGQPSTDSDSGNTAPTGYLAATAAPADSSSTASTVAADTGVLTTSGSASGIAVGMRVTMTGLPDNVFVLAQLSGAAGAGSGATYQLNYQGPAVSSATATFSQGNLVKITRQLPPAA
jgi:hypothetical protein